MNRLFYGLPVLLLAAACAESPVGPTGPAAGPVTAAAQAAEASAARETFEAAVNIPAPSVCLGGTFRITGTIAGWLETVVGPDGREKYVEHVDFSQLTATLGADHWVAAPGSHEIWSENFPQGDSAQVVVHEGRTRFVSDTGAPAVSFVHRIHRVWLPSGERQLNEVTFEAECYGRVE